MPVPLLDVTEPEHQRVVVSFFRHFDIHGLIRLGSTDRVTRPPASDRVPASLGFWGSNTPTQQPRTHPYNSATCDGGERHGV